MPRIEMVVAELLVEVVFAGGWETCVSRLTFFARTDVSQHPLSS